MSNQIARIISEVNRGCITNYSWIWAKRSSGALKICQLLTNAGFLSYYTICGNRIKVGYQRFPEHTLSSIQLISRYGRRVWWSYEKLKKKAIINGYTFYIVSTVKGVMSSDEALLNHYGGEIIASING